MQVSYEPLGPFREPDPGQPLLFDGTAGVRERVVLAYVGSANGQGVKPFTVQSRVYMFGSERRQGEVEARDVPNFLDPAGRYYGSFELVEEEEVRSSEFGVQSSEFGGSESEGVDVNGLAHRSTDLPGPFLVSAADGFGDETVMELGSRLDSLEAQMQFFSDLVLRVEQFGRRLEALEALVQAEAVQPLTGSGVDASLSSVSSPSSAVAETVNQQGEEGAVSELADFTWIRGIGDAKEQRLHAAGYMTYDMFLNANVEELADLLDVAPSVVLRMSDAIQEREGDLVSWPVVAE